MKDKKRAAKAAYITQFMLELYHLNIVTDKERKLIEDALSKDDDLRLRYEELKNLDKEIKAKYKLNEPSVFTIIKNDNDKIINKTNILKTKKIIIGLGIAALIICLCIPAFFYFSNLKNKGANAEITRNDTEHNIRNEDKQEIVIEENTHIENERIVVLPAEIKETEIKIEENKTTRTVRETEPVVIAETPKNESGVYVRGVTVEQKATETTEQNTISIPSGINFIFDSMFADRGLTEITLPERITFIGNKAFANNQIINVTIPENVTSIGNGAFSNNPLIRVTIGANVHVEDDAIPGNFANFYNTNSKTKGTYIRTNAISNDWRKQ